MNKEIFEYWNGERKVFGDPIALMRQFTVACGGDYRATLRAAYPDPEPEDPAAATVIGPAIDKLYAIIRGVFKMPSWDDSTGKGSTDAEVRAVLDQFLAWWLDVKKNTTSSLTSAPSTDCPGKSTTRPTADSGQTLSA